MISVYLLGYGRMGKKIHDLAGESGIKICGYNNGETDPSNDPEFARSDAVIDFSTPESAVRNITIAVESGLPVVSGTTGWLGHWEKVTELCTKSKGHFFYASNFSFGANVLFHLNRKLANIMKQSDDYHVEIKEIHHTRKLDKPSGTAATLANDIVERMPHLNGWLVDESHDGKLTIRCQREGDVKGFHEVNYRSAIDELNISHNAFSRDGFALGAIEAAKWVVKQDPGVYGMKDMLGLND